MKAFASKDNAAYKAVAKLIASAAERRKSGLSVLDGAHLLKAFVDGVGPPDSIYVSHAGADDAEIVSLLARCGSAPVTLLSDALFASLSTVDSPTGVLAVVRSPAGKPAPADAKLALVLENIQDPGNVGTLLRSAAAAGADHVLLSPTCAFAWSPKVLRAGMGAHFALNIAEGVELVPWLRAYQGQAVALAGQAAKSLYDVDLRGPVALVVGNEGAGLTDAVLAAVRTHASIPMAPHVESLNAGAAGAVALFEAARQRRMAR